MKTIILIIAIALVLSISLFLIHLKNCTSNQSFYFQFPKLAFLLRFCPENLSNDDSIIDDKYIRVRFKPNTDITAFARRYGIDKEDIIGPSKAGTYKVPILSGMGLLTTMETFEKDLDVENVEFIIYSHPF